MSRLDHREHNCQTEEKSGDIFRDFCQDITGASAEQSIAGRTAESEARTRFLFRKLDQNQKHQDYAVQHQQ